MSADRSDMLGRARVNHRHGYRIVNRPREWLRGISATLAIVSLVLQTLLSAPLGASLTPTGRAIPSWALASLCTMHGPTKADPAQEPAKPDPGNHSTDCSLCFCLHHAGGILPPSGTGLSLPDVADAVLVTTSDTGALVRAARSPAQPRAPPAAA
jgi:hypothetical protein